MLIAGQPDACPAQALPAPEINYLARDYGSFRQMILDRLAVTAPGWREQHVPDTAVAVVEILAYVADHLSYYQDAVAQSLSRHGAERFRCVATPGS